MDQAISDYLTTISLINDPSKTSYGIFKRLSLAYEAKREFCEAASALQTWVAANGEHDNSQLNFLVGNLKKKGDCTTDYATGRDTFRHQPNASGVIYADVYVNGVKGRFVVDTGAALVSVSRSFAERAGLKYSKDSEILLGTANGIAKGNRVTMDSVRVGKVKAEKVQGIAMQQSDALGEDIDGLLGRSFLARFDITFAKGKWVVSAAE
ncbi:retropepsin-like aspartic protease family protein [Aquamicrobium terrae]